MIKPLAALFLVLTLTIGLFTYSRTNNKETVIPVASPTTIPTLTIVPTIELTPTVIPTTAPTIAPSISAKPSLTRAPTPSPKPAIKSMPGEGYTSSNVSGHSLVCIGANRRNIRVVTDSANENDCKDNCPVMPLSEYASRNGGFAAMNGMYFCPQDYASCADKKNSFDTLFFNSRVGRYINSDNNVYSVLPFLAVLANGDTRFMGKTLEWGRDTSIQAGIAGNPMLVAGGRDVSGNYSLDDKQRNGRGPRGAVVRKGETIYLCVMAGVTVPESSSIYESLGVDDAMNIDGGGSTALWVNGRYIYGPGRNIPNAIIFANK